MATLFNRRASLNRYLKGDQGWLNFCVGIGTESGSVGSAIRFHDGKASVRSGIPDPCDIRLVFRSDDAVRKLLGATPTEQYFMLMKTIVEHMLAYVRAYFQLGGMQMQMNVVTSDTLRDAMAHPQNYRNLLVRISGYNAYFVTLNRDLQMELIARAEYGL